MNINNIKRGVDNMIRFLLYMNNFINKTEKEVEMYNRGHRLDRNDGSKLKKIINILF